MKIPTLLAPMNFFLDSSFCRSKIQMQDTCASYTNTTGVRYAKGILQVVVVGASDHTERIFNGAVVTPDKA